MPSKPASAQSAEPARLVWWALVPLRAFLGFTFCFAGLQKLANPGF
jgi:thiosulfate dehydrogenase [quinone] large subunit